MPGEDRREIGIGRLARRGTRRPPGGAPCARAWTACRAPRAGPGGARTCNVPRDCDRGSVSTDRNCLATSPSSSDRASAAPTPASAAAAARREALTEDRAAAQDAALELAEPVEPGGDERVDARRHVEVVDLADESVAMRVALGDHHAAVGEHAQRLDREQRHAGGVLARRCSAAPPARPRPRRRSAPRCRPR